MQVILTTALHNYKVPVIIKKLKNFTFCLGKSRENFINIFQDFPGLTNKIQGLSRTFQDSKKNPGLSRTFPGCGNPVYKSPCCVVTCNAAFVLFSPTLYSGKLACIWSCTAGFDVITYALQHLDVLHGQLLRSHINFHWQLGGHNNLQSCSSNDISHCSSSQVCTELDSAVSSF